MIKEESKPLKNFTLIFVLNSRKNKIKKVNCRVNDQNDLEC